MDRSVGFLGVGPEKTGTSWLHAILDTHPDLRLPPKKELTYFLQDRDYPNETFRDRLTKNNWHHKLYRRYAQSRLQEAFRYPRYTFRNRARIAWDLKYLLKTHDDDWYLSLFDFEPGTLAGEVSPQYFFLGRQQIEKVRRLCPDAKIIITLREPQDWIWSWVRMKVKKDGQDLMGPEIEAFVDRKLVSASFSRALQEWRSVFPKDQVEVFFFEDLGRDPWRFYCRVCEFLGIEPESEVRERVSQRVNPGRSYEMPAHLRERIESGWHDDVRKLKALVGYLPEEWEAQHGLS